jgi:hypothetical protein
MQYEMANTSNVSKAEDHGVKGLIISLVHAHLVGTTTGACPGPCTGTSAGARRRTFGSRF